MTKSNSIVHRYLPGHASETRENAILVPVEPQELADAARKLKDSGLPLVTVFAADHRAKKKGFCIRYAFRTPESDSFLVLVLSLSSTVFPSLASVYPACALYEREIMTMFGLEAEGHPDPRTLLLHEENWPKGVYPLRKDFAWDTRVPRTTKGEAYRFHTIEGEGIYEIPVGPVHAGIIEPGHFRFSVAGEEIVSLEARLGWVHKGVEKLFEALPLEKKVLLSERISGDSSFSHSLAFCEALETLTATKVPERAQYLRLVYAELERIANHIGDIGFIMLDTGYSFGGANGSRLRESVMRQNELLTGSRFLRGVNIPGGVSRDITEESALEMRRFLAELRKDLAELIRIADGSASLMNRLAGTGVLPKGVAEDYGVVGVVARACGIKKDVRVEHPYAAYASLTPEITLEKKGDVEARFRIRIAEVLESMRLIESALSALPKGHLSAPLRPIPQEGIALSAVEGWRGEIAYAILAEDGVISRVKVRDPSFINWQIYPYVPSTDMVPDFPLINKSFNLSYSGNDL